eukprot:CAMPEP_0113323170 /NCGR_PEP_ID=MMETSP0010_2-20120614/16103_1 /TAXON_ID=216773 ORGANISM="Corethron hystrix, Strain 308" /NCGR_SAMPLE_ID=MMETSP0010_2 /ASSEMBLY_ACC=CAM_ASM_000155 /LENGTH=127 /DNA_ID=CAMNT_0000181933 /DNA_START=36 /DNA_END=416 /DNA_ORIENTATION=+ /assembly_acc=CAM_ASM_000155
MALLLNRSATAAFMIKHAGGRTKLGPEKVRMNRIENVGGDFLPEKTIDDGSLLESLRSRQQEIEKGAGRRYITRTQKGFLNVHSTHESGPYAVDNIVGQLEEGQIVTSVGSYEEWIEHDAGGWSISK